MTSAVESGGAKRCQSTPMLLGAHEREEKEACISYYYQHPRFENLTPTQMAFLVFLRKNYPVTSSSTIHWMRVT